jgi:dCMP deaminase
MKPKYIKAHMKTADNYASLSTARRLQVGAIVVKDDRIISIGYNGMPAGWDNNCEAG